MSSGDLAFTIIVCVAIAAYAAVRITRIITGNWDN